MEQIKRHKTVGVKIGDGASIGPCTLVSRNVPAGAIVTGNEMHIRKRRV